jgi:hypothetical protein
MSLDVKVIPACAWTRVAVGGEAGLGRLLSLLQVLEVDSHGWSADAVLLDLRELHARFDPDEQLRLAWEVARVLRRIKKVALLAPQGRLREAAGVRLFAAEDEALRWLGACA